MGLSFKLIFDDKTYSIDPVAEGAQELIVADGLKEWVKKIFKTIAHGDTNLTDQHRSVSFVS